VEVVVDVGEHVGVKHQPPLARVEADLDPAVRAL
jgi:hypothetical protein